MTFKVKQLPFTCHAFHPFTFIFIQANFIWMRILSLHGIVLRSSTFTGNTLHIHWNIFLWLPAAILIVTRQWKSYESNILQGVSPWNLTRTWLVLTLNLELCNCFHFLLEGMSPDTFSSVMATSFTVIQYLMLIIPSEPDHQVQFI